MTIRLFYEVHKTKIKICISVLISIIILAIIIYNIVSNPELNIPFYDKKQNTYTTISDSNNIFQISLNNKYNLKNTPSDSYILNIQNQDGFSFTVSQVEKYNFSLDKILKSDQDNFLKSLGNYTNLSKIKEKKYTNISGYSYSLQCSLNSTEYKLTEFITEINGMIYFFDIKYALENESKYITLGDELLNSIIMLNNKI